MRGKRVRGSRQEDLWEASEAWLRAMASPRGDKRVERMKRVLPVLLELIPSPGEERTALEAAAQQGMGAIMRFQDSAPEDDVRKAAEMAAAINAWRDSLDEYRRQRTV